MHLDKYVGFRELILISIFQFFIGFGFLLLLERNINFSKFLKFLFSNSENGTRLVRNIKIF